MYFLLALCSFSLIFVKLVFNDLTCESIDSITVICQELERLSCVFMLR